MIYKRNVKNFVRKGELEKIENYDKALADKTQTWICHHRLEVTLDGEFAHTPEELQRMGMYFNRPYFELIFLTRAEHNKLHKQGISLSTEAKKNISEGHKNKHHSDFGKKYFAHFGYSKSENPKQYKRENNWYCGHNKKCRWEI